MNVLRIQAEAWFDICYLSGASGRHRCPVTTSCSDETRREEERHADVTAYAVVPEAMGLFKAGRLDFLHAVVCLVKCKCAFVFLLYGINIKGFYTIASLYHFMWILLLGSI